MIDFLKWYFLIQLLGLINLPLTFSVFQKLRSRGIHLAKPLGLLLWGFTYWWLVSIGLLKNDLPSSLVALGIVLLANLFCVKKIGWTTFVSTLMELKKLILFSEILFLVMFAFWTLVRAANPDIIHTEKFMEMAFINAILKAETFPPHDPWLSGYGISYYYFGYVLSALLIRLSAVASSVGYNLVSSLWFGLTALAAYGLLWDLLTKRKESDAQPDSFPNRTYWLAFLAPLMILIVSNWFGLFDILHARGLASPEGLRFLNLPALEADPFNTSWFPNRGGWSWWQGSRVIQDFRLNGTAIEIIDEFPFFTFLLSDIHPHLLGMPFVILAISQGLNALFGGWDDEKIIFGRKVRINALNGILAVLTLGGIAFLNTWDFPFYLLLIAFALVWRWSQQGGWNNGRIGQLAILGLVGGLLSVLAYLPFYLSFSSQAGGLLPSLAFFTQGKSLWIMFGPLLVPIFLWLISDKIKTKRFLSKKAFFLTLLLFGFLFLVGWGLGFLAGKLPNMDQLLNGLQGSENNQQLLLHSILARIKAPGAFLTLFFLVWLGLDQFLKKLTERPSEELNQTLSSAANIPSAKTFVLMLILLGALLVIIPEFIYLRDQFSTRMNTIFKFYFQAWILWSIAGSYALIQLVKKADGKSLFLWAMLITTVGVFAFAYGAQERTNDLEVGIGATRLDYLILAIPALFMAWIIISLIKKKTRLAMGVVGLMAMAAGLIYPAIELWNKTEGFAPRDGFSLDGKQDFYVVSADEMTAAEWLQRAPLGVMAEAVSDSGGSYTTYNMVSTFSGMPTVLGWIGHESQWRGGYNEIGSRQNDLRELYSTASWERARNVIDLYNIRYIVVGELERATYSVDVSKFEFNLRKVLDTNSVDIYEVDKP